MATVLDFALVPEHQVRRALLGRQILKPLHRQQVDISIPDSPRFGGNLSFGQLAYRHRTPSLSRIRSINLTGAQTIIRLGVRSNRLRVTPRTAFRQIMAALELARA